VVDDEGDLVARCLSGDGLGVRAFVDRFQGAVFGLCYRMLGHRQDAEDITQEVFVRAFRSLSHWDSTRPLKPWLFTIAANRCRTALANRSRKPIFKDCDHEVPAVEEEGLSAAELAEEVQTALGLLREEYRLCFILFHQQDYSCAQIGEVLGCPQGTVKTWLHRARRELAEHLKRRGMDGEVNHELHRI
jgi:RNA polymerase sigma-70 factor (ECF subfamily)